jgi:sarcosine oxidase
VRIVVVGGGVIGLLTAVECVLAGHRVTVVEQGDLPSQAATSFDRHRTMRALHPGDPAATAAAVQAHGRWLELEQLLGCRFYHRVGALSVLPADAVPGAAATLGGSGARLRMLDAAELSRAYPHIAFPADTGAVLEPDAGVLLADRVLAACVGWLRWQPTPVLYPHRTAIEVDGNAPAVRLADGEVIAADAVVVAAGPWSRELLPAQTAAGLTLHRQSLLYCRVPEPVLPQWAATPTIVSLGTREGAWLVPPVAGTPLKLSAATACRTVDELAGQATPAGWRTHLEETFAPLLRGFRSDWVTDTRDCYYLASAPTGGPLTVDLGTAAVCYAACGGSSFKSAPLIAQSLARRVTAPEPVSPSVVFETL